MEIGIIIFVIWIIISVISGIVENGAKNKKKKQNTQWPAHPNPSKKPVQRQASNQVDNAQLELQELVKKFYSYKEKAETSSTDRMSNHYKQLAKQLSTHLEKQGIDVEQVNTKQNNSETQPQTQSQAQSTDAHENELINKRKEEIHKNKPKSQKEAIKNLLEFSKEEKQSLSKVQQESFEKLEEEANEIIHNTQLSERTRRTMVKQLYLNSKHKFNDEAVNIDENNVVNGIIWSEILKRPEGIK